jgi:hypothetical protein
VLRKQNLHQNISWTYAPWTYREIRLEVYLMEYYGGYLRGMYMVGDKPENMQEFLN